MLAATPGHRAYPGVWLIYPVTHFIGESEFFSLCHQISVASSFLDKGGNLCPLCPQCYDSIWLDSVQVLCVLHSVCESTCPVVSGRYCFLGVIHPLWLLQSFCFLFYIVPWAPRVWLGEGISFDSERSQASHSLHVVPLHLRSSFLIASDKSKRNLRKHLKQGKVINVLNIKIIKIREMIWVFQTKYCIGHKTGDITQEQTIIWAGLGESINSVTLWDRVFFFFLPSH